MAGTDVMELMLSVGEAGVDPDPCKRGVLNKMIARKGQFLRPHPPFAETMPTKLPRSRPTGSDVNRARGDYSDRHCVHSCDRGTVYRRPYWSGGTAHGTTICRGQSGGTIGSVTGQDI